MKKIFTFFTAILLLVLNFSCSNNDDDSSSIPNFSYFTLENITDYSDPNTATSIWMSKGYLNNNKIKEVASVNSVTNQEYTMLSYTYTNGLLTTQSMAYEFTNYYYDSQNRLIASYWMDDTSQTSYNRYNYVTTSKVYCENITLPYDDPSTQIISRVILEFDSNDNVVKAGVDSNLDGISESENTFEYTNNNMTAIHFSDGTETLFQYSNIKDNFTYIYDNSYGKQNRRLLNAIYFTNQNLNYFGFSENLTQNDVSNSSFVLLGNGYFMNKKSVSVLSNPSAVQTLTIKFFL